MFLLYYIKSIAQSIIATTLMLSDTPHEKLFWQKYFSSNTEFKQYVTAMLTHPLPHDILRVILLHYLAVAGDTIETISDPYALFFAKQLSTLPTEKHDMFQYRWITLTTDGKYCITSHNKWHSSDAVRLWDIATKESIIIAKTHITPFKYLKKTNRVLCLESIHNNTARLYCYDIITHTKHTIYSIDIPLSEWWLNIKVDPQEQHCALLAHNFLIIANLTTMHTAEWPLNHYSPQTLALNNDTQLCAIHTHNKANRNNYLQLFALTDTGWQQVITDFLLPLYPSKMSFMKDNYLLLYRYEHYGTTRCLHVRITKNDNNEYEIKTIDSSYGNDCIVNKANNNFFNCTTTDYKNSYLVSHDGSLVKQTDNVIIRHSGSAFSNDGKYYVAIGKRCVLLLSLNPINKTAQEITHRDLLEKYMHVQFHPYGPFFICFDQTQCSLYKTSGKKLCSWSIPEAYSYYFSPDGYSLITPATQESHPLFSQKQIEQIEYIQENVPNDLALQEYFLLKNCNTHDIEFKESLYKSSSKDCQQLYDTMTKQLGDGK